MDKLTQLLEERWPINSRTPAFNKTLLEEQRKLFTEGYNARIAEEKEDHLLDMPTPGYNRKQLVEECFKLIKESRPLDAISLYRKATGSSNGWAKFALSI